MVKALRFRFYTVLTGIVLMVPFTLSFFSGMQTVSDASPSGYCGHCMKYWDDQHYNISYQKWECPKLFCGEEGYDEVSKTRNTRMSCWTTYNDENPTEKRCHDHEQCSTCGRERDDKWKRCRKKKVKIVMCGLCDTEMRRETVLDIQISEFGCPSVNYFESTDYGSGPGECCEKCDTCDKKVSESVHERPHKKKYKCCTDNAGTITTTGHCGTDYIEDMGDYCYTCLCLFDWTDILVEDSICYWPIGFFQHTRAFHTKVTCNNCRSSEIVTAFEIPLARECSHYPAIPPTKTVQACGKCP